MRLLVCERRKKISGMGGKIHNYLLYYKEKSQVQAFALSKKLFFCQLLKALYEIGLVAIGRLG